MALPSAAKNFVRLLLTSNGITSTPLQEELDGMLAGLGSKGERKCIWYIPTALLDGEPFFCCGNEQRRKQLLEHAQHVAKTCGINGPLIKVPQLEGEPLLPPLHSLLTMQGDEGDKIGVIDPLLLGEEMAQAVATLKPNIIYLDRGNTFALQHFLRESGAGNLIQRCASDGVPIIGVSAGSVVMGRSVRTTFWKGRKDSTLGGRVGKEYWTAENARGLALVGKQSVFVHANRDHPEYGDVMWRQARAAEHGPEYEDVLALADGEGLVVCGVEQRMVLLNSG